jgi:hypothetical protein
MDIAPKRTKRDERSLSTVFSVINKLRTKS